jgi:hypothetical protein
VQLAEGARPQTRADFLRRLGIYERGCHEPPAVRQKDEAPDG